MKKNRVVLKTISKISLRMISIHSLIYYLGNTSSLRSSENPNYNDYKEKKNRTHMTILADVNSE